MLPVDPDGRVLLLHCINPSAPDDPYWVAIGGGLESGEDERAAAVRELWEETALVVDPGGLVGPLHEETIEFGWAEFDIVQHQTYYAADVSADAPISFEHMEEVEVETTLGYRWWALADLRSTTERVLSNQVAVIEDLIRSRAAVRGSGSPGW